MEVKKSREKRLTFAPESSSVRVDLKFWGKIASYTEINNFILMALLKNLLISWNKNT